MSEYTIFGYVNQLKRNDTDPSTREKGKICATVPGSTGEVISLHKETKLINWSPCINSNWSFASTSAVSSHAATTNFRIAGNRGLQLKNNFVCKSEARTGLVGAKSSFNPGKVNNFCISSVNNSFRCFFKRMRSFLQRAHDWEIMDIVRKQMSYKYFAILTFNQMHPSVQSIHLQMNNIVTLSYLVKMGGYPQQNSLRYKQRDLGLLAGQRDHNYRRISSSCSQQRSRFPVTSSERHKRMEVGSQCFSSNMQEVGASRHRPFCFQNFSSGPNIHIIEVGSIQQGKGRFSNNMDISKRICFPAFCTNRSSLEQSAKRESDCVANYRSLANAIMVSTTVTTHSANTIASTKNSEPFTRFKQRKASLDRAGKLTTPGEDSLRERLHAEGVLEDSAVICSY